MTVAWRELYVSLAILFFLLALGMLVFCLAEGMTWVNGLYYVVVSATTIGYGDESPDTPGAKLFSLVWLVLVTVWLGKCIGDMLSVKSEAHLERVRAKLLAKDLDRNDLKALDVNHDGTVSRYEYLKYQLIEGEYPIDAGDIDAIMAAFDRLDKDGDNDVDLADLGGTPKTTPRGGQGGLYAAVDRV